MSRNHFLDAVSDADLRRVAEAKIANLHDVQTSARTVGMAMGMLMERQNLSESDAFEVLIYLSERSGQMVRDIAADIVDTGDLPHA